MNNVTVNGNELVYGNILEDEPNPIEKDRNNYLVQANVLNNKEDKVWNLDYVLQNAATGKIRIVYVLENNEVRVSVQLEMNNLVL